MLRDGLKRLGIVLNFRKCFQCTFFFDQRASNRIGVGITEPDIPETAKKAITQFGSSYLLNRICCRG
ncbi:MAG: hypothetical protein DMG30_14895 [Acidobacteria bacterium]|nr:MAG: hypothetical protein DMG30_14895 [Acidobacteriota bacterium]